MKNKDQMMLEEAYRIVCEGEVLSPQELAQKFHDDVLSQYSYKLIGDGHLNCAWATKTFCEWCENVMKLPCKAIYFVWQNKKKTKELMDKGVLPPYHAKDGMSHIAPVYNNHIVDITFGQFDNNGNEIVKITSLGDWKSVYGPYGYDGTNVWEDENTGEKFGPIYVGSLSDVERWSTSNDLGKMEYPAPPKKK